MENRPTVVANYITGSSGFLGRKLFQSLQGETIPIPHGRIDDFEVTNCDRFFFLSTYGNMAQHDNHFGKILKANVLDLGHVLTQILRYKLDCSSFVFVSSSSVNLKVQTPYSRTKKAAEEILQATDLPYCIIRPYSVTGAGEQKEHLIPTLIRSCMEGASMDLVPDATHDFVDVEDVVAGILMLSERRKVGIFELGSGVETSNGEVRSIVEKITGRKANVRIVDSMRTYDNEKWYCEDRAEGWFPKKSLEQSITEMVEEYAKVS